MKSFVLLIPAALLFALVAVSAQAADCARPDACVGASSCTIANRTGDSCGSASSDVCCRGAAGNPSTTTCASIGGTCKNTATECVSPSRPDTTTYVCGVTQPVCCVPQGVTTPGANASNCVKDAAGKCAFKNPLAFDTVEGFLAQILSWLRSIVVALALVVIVIGGLLYITSAGDEGKAETAKKWITGAMIGLAIVFLAPTIFNELGSILGWTGTSATGAKTVAEILKSVLMFLLALAGSIALIMLVVGGFMYLFAGVDEHRAETGKDIVKYSVIGLIIIMSSYVIVQTVASLFA